MMWHAWLKRRPYHFGLGTWAACCALTHTRSDSDKYKHLPQAGYKFNPAPPLKPKQHRGHPALLASHPSIIKLTWSITWSHLSAQHHTTWRAPCRWEILFMRLFCMRAPTSWLPATARMCYENSKTTWIAGWMSLPPSEGTPTVWSSRTRQ